MLLCGSTRRLSKNSSPNLLYPIGVGQVDTEADSKGKRHVADRYLMEDAYQRELLALRFEGTLPGHAERGQLQIDGANGSVLVLTILDSVNIQGDVDEDGDGVFDATFLTTWDALFS